MEILVLSSDPERLAALERLLREAFPEGRVAAFSDPLLSIQHAALHGADAVFCEPALKVMDGGSLVCVLRRRYPRIRSVLLLEPDSGKLPDSPADALLVLPATVEKLKAALPSASGPAERTP